MLAVPFLMMLASIVLLTQEKVESGWFVLYGLAVAFVPASPRRIIFTLRLAAVPVFMLALASLRSMADRRRQSFRTGDPHQGHHSF